MDACSGEVHVRVAKMLGCSLKRPECRHARETGHLSTDGCVHVCSIAACGEATEQPHGKRADQDCFIVILDARDVRMKCTLCLMHV